MAYAQHSSTRSGNTEQGKPQGGIAVVPGFRRVTEFVVHLHFCHRTFKHGCRLVGGQHIGRRCNVRHLGHHILPDTEIINDDLAVFIRREYADIAVRTGDMERESLDLAV